MTDQTTPIPDDDDLALSLLVAQVREALRGHDVTDADLERKFHDLSDPILGAGKAQDILAACWHLGDAPNLQGVLQLLKP